MASWIQNGSEVCVKNVLFMFYYFVNICHVNQGCLWQIYDDYYYYYYFCTSYHFECSLKLDLSRLIMVLFFFKGCFFFKSIFSMQSKSAAYLIKKQEQNSKGNKTWAQRVTKWTRNAWGDNPEKQSWYETTKLNETKNQDLQHKITNTNVTNVCSFKEQIQDSNRQFKSSRVPLHIKRYNNINCLFFLFLFSFLKWTFPITLS